VPAETPCQSCPAICAGEPLRQLLQQRLRLFQDRRVEAFGEPAVDRRERVARSPRGMSSATFHPSSQMSVTSSPYVAGAASQHGLGGMERGAKILASSILDEQHSVDNDIPLDSDPLARFRRRFRPKSKSSPFLF